MLHATLTTLARQRRPFAHFYRALAPALSRVSPQRRMTVTASLWRATSNMADARTLSQRAEYARRLFRRQQQRKHQPRDRRPVAKPTHINNKRRTRAMARRTRSLTPATATMPFDAFCKAVVRHARARLTPRERDVLQRVYRSTASVSTLRPADRLAVARSVLRALRQNRRQRAAAPRRRRHALHTSHRSRPHRAATRRHRHVVRVHPQRAAAGADKASTSPAFTAFRRDVLAQTGLTPTREWDGRIYRMWLVLVRRRGLSQARRVEAAVRLIPKLTRHGAAGRRHTTALSSPAAAVTASSAVRAVSPRSSSPRKPRQTASGRVSRTNRRRNMYLKFYREMLLTGHVPNKPVKARTRRIKQLWRAVHHRKSFAERVNLAKQILIGVPVKSEVKPSPRRSDGAVVKAGARTRHPSRASPVVKPGTKAEPPAAVAKPAEDRVIRFVVPANYSVNPFAATYAVLNPYMKHKSANARMRAVARAWTRTQAKGADHRSPHARIKAVADALQLKA